MTLLYNRTYCALKGDFKMIDTVGIEFLESNLENENYFNHCRSHFSNLYSLFLFKPMGGQ